MSKFLVFSVRKESLFYGILVFFYLFITLIGTNFLSGEGHVLDSSDTGESDFLKQFLFLLLSLIVMAKFFLSKFSIKNILKPNVFFFIFLIFILALLSAFWSSVPYVTIKRAILTLIVFIIPLFISMMYPREIFFNSIMNSLVIIVILSIFAALFHPYGVHTTDTLDEQLVGAWKGLFPHKNKAGAVASVGAGLSILMYVLRRQKIHLFYMGVFLFFLLMTASKTSLLLLFPSLFFVYLYKRFYGKLRLTHLFAMGLFISPVIYYIVVYISAVLSSPESLTGRTTIWYVITEIIWDNPIFGVGFSSVYHVGNQSVLFDYTGDWVEFVAHGHNGYLDIILYMGFVGFILFFWAFIKPYMNALNFFIRSECLSMKIISYCSLFIIFFFLMHNITESSFFDTTRHGWVFFSLFFSILMSGFQSHRINNNNCISACSCNEGV